MSDHNYLTGSILTELGQLTGLIVLDLCKIENVFWCFIDTSGN
jgi:hypothetical protein